MGDDPAKAAHGAAAEEAAEEAVDQERLLDGEDPDTGYREDAVHWMSVYGELVAFKEDLVTHTESRVSEMRADAAHEVAITDLPVLRAEARRLRRRLELWSQRVAEIPPE